MIAWSCTLLRYCSCVDVRVLRAHMGHLRLLISCAGIFNMRSGNERGSGRLWLRRTRVTYLVHVGPYVLGPSMAYKWGFSTSGKPFLLTYLLVRSKNDIGCNCLQYMRLATDISSWLSPRIVAWVLCISEAFSARPANTIEHSSLQNIASRLNLYELKLKMKASVRATTQRIVERQKKNTHEQYSSLYMPTIWSS